MSRDCICLCVHIYVPYLISSSSDIMRPVGSKYTLLPLQCLQITSLPLPLPLSLHLDLYLIMISGSVFMIFFFFNFKSPAISKSIATSLYYFKSGISSISRPAYSALVVNQLFSYDQTFPLSIGKELSASRLETRERAKI